MSGAVEFTEERIELFPTRFLRRQYEELEGFNRKLTALVLAREKADDGSPVRRSNVGGWHSDNDLLRWDAPELKVLIELIQSTVAEYVALELGRDPGSFDLVLQMEAWANVTRTGDYARPHVHPLANFAIVYYPDVGDGPSEGLRHGLGGCIEFLDPRSRVTMLKTPGVDGRDSVTVRPRQSMMLCFPAWVHHYVHPYAGKRPRISIAANVTVRELRERSATTERPDALILEDG